MTINYQKFVALKLPELKEFKMLALYNCRSIVKTESSL